jgi:hypothetical protein
LTRPGNSGDNTPSQTYSAPGRRSGRTLPTLSVITITGSGDHDRPEQMITITGIRSRRVRGRSGRRPLAEQQPDDRLSARPDNRESTVSDDSDPERSIM